MSALDLSLAAKMMQKVQSRKRRKCANDISSLFTVYLFTFGNFALYDSLEQIGPSGPEREI